MIYIVFLVVFREVIEFRDERLCSGFGDWIWVLMFLGKGEFFCFMAGTEVERFMFLRKKRVWLMRCLC